MGVANDIFDRLLDFEKANHLLGELENHHLDFKEASDPAGGVSRDDQKNYAKAVSGFGNEDGGVIVWGIKCRKDPSTDIDQATEIKYISNPTAFSSRLNEITIGISDPVLSGIINKPLIDPNDAESRGVVVTYIPSGPDKPYKALARENEYFGRTTSNFFPYSTSQLR